MKQPSLNSPVFSHESGEKVAIGHVPIRQAHVCMCVCVQLPRAYRLLRLSIDNVSKRLDYSAVVYRGAVPGFCSCYHPTGRWRAALWAEKHGLIEEPLTVAVFESVARRTARPATNTVCVQGFGGFVQLMCVWLA